MWLYQDDIGLDCHFRFAEMYGVKSVEPDFSDSPPDWKWLSKGLFFSYFVGAAIGRPKMSAPGIVKFGEGSGRYRTRLPICSDGTNCKDATSF